jgi:hypothetical protein
VGNRISAVIRQISNISSRVCKSMWNGGMI